MQDSRKAPRANTTLAAACRVRGIAHRAKLSEVSQAGCCAEMAHQVALPGDRVLLQLGRSLVLPAVVRWVAEGRAGLAFANPLHGAMLSHLACSRSSTCVARTRHSPGVAGGKSNRGRSSNDL